MIGLLVHVECHHHPVALDPFNTCRRQAVIELDAAAFGVQRPDAMAGLYRLGEDVAWVTTDASGAVSGFLLSRPGRRFFQLGPLVAKSDTAAKALYATARGEIDQPLVLDLPLGKGAWVEWVTAQGFEQQRPFTRMFRGVAPRPERASDCHAISGPELG